jgi:hypothetical protein
VDYDVDPVVFSHDGNREDGEVSSVKD